MPSLYLGVGVGVGEQGKVCCRVHPASSCAGKYLTTSPTLRPQPFPAGQRDPGPGSSRRQVASSSASINREAREPRAAELRQRERRWRRRPGSPTGALPATAAAAAWTAGAAPAALLGAPMSRLPDRERARTVTTREVWPPLSVDRGPGGGCCLPVRRLVWVLSPRLPGLPPFRLFWEFSLEWDKVHFAKAHRTAREGRWAWAGFWSRRTGFTAELPRVSPDAEEALPFKKWLCFYLGSAAHHLHRPLPPPVSSTNRH